MANLYQDYLSLGAGGIGLSGHKNRYSSSVCIANWVEDATLERPQPVFKRGKAFLDMDVPFQASTTTAATYRAPGPTETAAASHQHQLRREVKHRATGAARDSILPVHMSAPNTMHDHYLSMTQLAFAEPTPYKRTINTYAAGKPTAVKELVVQELVDTYRHRTYAAPHSPTRATQAREAFKEIEDKSASMSTTRLFYDPDTAADAKVLTKGRIGA